MNNMTFIETCFYEYLTRESSKESCSVFYTEQELANFLVSKLELATSKQLDKLLSCNGHIKIDVLGSASIKTTTKSSLWDSELTFFAAIVVEKSEFFRQKLAEALASQCFGGNVTLYALGLSAYRVTSDNDTRVTVFVTEKK